MKIDKSYIMLFISYSLCSDAIRSSLAAFRAGIPPTKRPTISDKLNPIAIDHNGTINGNLKIVAALNANATPDPTPIVPPTVEMTTASIKTDSKCPY